MVSGPMCVVVAVEIRVVFAGLLWMTSPDCGTLGVVFGAFPLWSLWPSPVGA